MKTTAKQPGVSQLERDDIQAVAFQEPDQRMLTRALRMTEAC